MAHNCSINIEVVFRKERFPELFAAMNFPGWQFHGFRRLYDSPKKSKRVEGTAMPHGDKTKRQKSQQDVMLHVGNDFKLLMRSSMDRKTQLQFPRFDLFFLQLLFNYAQLNRKWIYIVILLAWVDCPQVDSSLSLILTPGSVRCWTEDPLMIIGDARSDQKLNCHGNMSFFG